MNILTNENTTFSMNNVNTEVDVSYGILNYSDPKNVDYMFVPLLFLETFNISSIDLRIGPYRVKMPSDWHIIIGDKHSGEMELLALNQINDREFDAFVFNPITGFYPQFLEIEVMNIFPDVKWNIPRMGNGNLLAVPLEEKPNPQCAYFVKEVNKLPATLDITQMV